MRDLLNDSRILVKVARSLTQGWVEGDFNGATGIWMVGWRPYQGGIHVFGTPEGIRHMQANPVVESMGRAVSIQFHEMEKDERPEFLTGEKEDE